MHQGGTRVRRSQQFLPLLLFAVSTVVYTASPVDTVYDSRWVLPIALSLVREGNTDLEEFREAVVPGDYRIREINGKLRDIYPLAPAVFAVPFVFVLDHAAAWRGMDLQQVLQHHVLARVQVFIAALVVSLAGVFMFLTARTLTHSLPAALAAWLIFAFAGPCWSSATRTLGTNALTIAALAAVLYLLVRNGRKLQWPGVLVIGALLGWAVVLRPTNVFALLGFGIYTAAVTPRLLPVLLLGSAAAAWPILVYDYALFGSWLPGTYAALRDGFFVDGMPWEGLAGTLFSPSRGLFIFSPVFMLIFAGVRLWWWDHSQRLLIGCVVGITAAGWLAVASWQNWWGGHSVGPRLLSDLVPLLVFLLLPVLERCLQSPLKTNAWFWALIVLVAVSLLINGWCAVSWEVVDWNSAPVNIDLAPERLWDWHDPQFLRGLRS